MIYGYARCSTSETKQDINRQKRELKEMGAKHIFWEYESSTNLNRPEFDKLMLIVRPGDTIVATEISRITRSVKQMCDIMQVAKDMQLKLVFGSFILDCSGKEIDPMTETMLYTMTIFAELERKMTVQRVKSGLRNARAKGKQLGRPRLTIDKIPDKVIKHLKLWREGYITKTEYAKICGVSRATIHSYIKILTEQCN